MLINYMENCKKNFKSLALIFSDIKSNLVVIAWFNRGEAALRKHKQQKGQSSLEWNKFCCVQLRPRY